MTLRTLGLAVVLCTVARLSAAAGTGISGHVTDPSGLPLPGVVVTLSTVSENPSDAPQTVASGVTDQSGGYTFDVPGGQYGLTAELSGFQLVKRAVVVQADVTTVDVSLALASFQDSVTITADSTPPTLLAAPQPNAPVTVSRTVINAAMLPNSRYEDVLTLMPNVERGPDNRISVGGAPASTGSLVVNGFNETDPADGLPGVVVPVDAVDSVDVHTGGYAADMGRATSGVTSIQTRSGANQFHTSVDSIFPRFLFEDGGVHGVEYWEPNIGASGPIVKGRLFFETALSYRFDRNRFTTLAGPERSTYNQPLFWSQLDGNLSSTAARSLRVCLRSAAHGSREHHRVHSGHERAEVGRGRLEHHAVRSPRVGSEHDARFEWRPAAHEVVRRAERIRPLRAGAFARKRRVLRRSIETRPARRGGRHTHDAADRPPGGEDRSHGRSGVAHGG